MNLYIFDSQGTLDRVKEYYISDSFNEAMVYWKQNMEDTLKEFDLAFEYIINEDFTSQVPQWILFVTYPPYGSETIIVTQVNIDTNYTGYLGNY